MDRKPPPGTLLRDLCRHRQHSRHVRILDLGHLPDVQANLMARPQTSIRFASRKLMALSDGGERRVIPGDEARSPSPVEVTAVSRIRGTQRIQEDTKGYGEVGG